METAETSPTALELRLETIRQLIESFTSAMTKEQWRLIQVGSPDHATKAMLADLLLDIISIITKAVLATFSCLNVMVPADCVQSSLVNALTESFAEVLGVKDEAQTVSTERLTDLIVKEVAESVSSALSTSDGFAVEPSVNRVTPQQTLKAMIRHACTMLKAFTAKMDISCRPQRQRRHRTDDQWKQEDTELVNITGEHQSPNRFVEPETKEDVSSEDSFVMKTSKIVQEIINRNVKDITEPFLDELPDSEYGMLKTESSKEIKVVADDIAQIISEEIRSLRESDAAGPSPTSEHSGKMSMKDIRSKVKNFFAMQFAKALILRIVANVRAKFHRDSRVESRESFESLMDDVDSLLLTEDGEKQTGELGVIKKFKKITPGKVHVFTQQLSDLLYSHIADRMPKTIPETTAKRATCRTVCVPQPHAAMYAEIMDKVRMFLGMMNYWVNCQVFSHSRRVIRSLMDLVSPTAQLPGAPTVEETHLGACAVSELVKDPTLLAKQRKISVGILVKKLIQRTFREAKLEGGEKSEAVSQRVFDKTWAEVEGLDFSITHKTFTKLDKDIFKDLCKGWGCAEQVLVSMFSEEPEIESYIASSFKSYLTAPRHSTISRFLSDCKTITDQFTLKCGCSESSSPST
ncbi:uncharacterized protein LOC113159301 [Anabas testudineus]|uniref:uncharacterized protein LOC113159301 n=1 Tax=Anabas testudineus TaxID=64144 RepID=UPI000E4575DA|nr:uncharacterized protein LOC113159301 [Anabas testudineus]